MSVVIPAYNEETAIVPTVSAVRDWLREQGRPYEILIVDNASEDGTAQRLAPLLQQPDLGLLRNERNRGKGYSVRRGMLATSGELRLHCDADCGPSMASLSRMLELLDGADVVVGSRLAPGAAVGRRQPLARRIVGRSFVNLCRAILREPTTDLFCGFKLFRGPAAADVFARVSIEGWAYDAEALALARRLGYGIRETGIAWTDREGSRLSMRRVLVPVLRELVQARRHVVREGARGRAAATPSPTPSSPR